MNELWLRIKALFHRRQLDRDLDDELAFHLAMREQKLAESGVPAEEAPHAARRQFGNATRAKEASRELWSFPFLEILWQDIRYGLRQLRRSPGFTVVAVLTLALGIGANTGIFAVIYAVLLRPLPYPNPGRLVDLRETEGPGTNEPVPYLDFLDWQRENHSFTQLAAWMADDLILTGRGGAEEVSVADVSGGFFSTLGVKLALGRPFLPQEDKQGGAPVAILSHGFWERAFGGSPGALGKGVALSGKDYTVVGVLPAGFRFSGTSDIWVPIGQGDPSWTEDRKIRNGIEVIGRLRPGVTLDQARADMAVVQERIAKTHPDSDAGVSAGLLPLKREFVGYLTGTLLLLMAAVGFVLLIACVNVANLMLARSAGREREFAVRAALGAGRAQLFRQLLVESTMLALMGGTLGVAIAQWGTHPVLGLIPGGLPRGEGIRVDPHVLGFALAISILTGILFGLAPALRSTKASLQEGLKEGCRATEAGSRRTQSVLVVAETALTLVLLVAAGLMIRTMWRLSHVDPGFNPSHAVTFSLAVAPHGASSPGSIRLAFHRLLAQVRGVPGVQAAGLTNMVPLGGTISSAGFSFGPSVMPPRQSSSVHPSLLSITTPEYFRALQIPLLHGRSFTEEDTIASPHVVVVDEALAREFFPRTDPVGKWVNVMFLGPAEIVGVSGNVRYSGLASNPEPAIYFPLEQVPDGLMSMTLGGMSLVVRARANLATLVPAIRRALMGPGSDQALFNAQTMEQVVGASTAGTQLPLVLLGIFGGLALLLASVGIYGVVSYAVARRAHEIGVRMALGAQRGNVLAMVVAQGLKLTLVGVGIGAAGALALTRYLSSLLYGVKPTDPLTFAVVALVLTSVALAACYIPARRAMRVDPVTALKYE